MHQRYSTLAFYVVVLVLASTGIGLATNTEAPPRQPEAGAASLEQETRIEADQATGTIRFIVDGKPQAWLDATGLHYHGTITREGAGAEESAAPQPEAPQPEDGQP